VTSLHVRFFCFQVDQGNWSALETVEDVHVLTGTLKLFFRELKEPLIPWECVSPLLSAASDQSLSRKQRGKRLREIVCGDKFPSVPPLHRATLQLLLRHLLRVTAEKEHNRMQIPNLSIVFGPTLMWPPPNASQASQHNLALDMMQQNIIVESLLNNVDNIFGAEQHS
jgi:hypothetical protein